MRTYLKVNNPEIGAAILSHMHKNKWQGGYAPGYYFVSYLDEVGHVNASNDDWLKKNRYKEVTLSEFLEQKPDTDKIGNYGIEVFSDKVEVADSHILVTLTYEEVKEIVSRMR